MKVLFAGSFDPFTIGHKDVVDRALSLFDKVVIGIGYNINKKYLNSAEEIAENIKDIFSNDSRVEVKTYTGLTVDFAKEERIDCFIRSIRSVKDYEYERNLADINKEISGIETIFIFSKPEHSFISSSMVRELMSYGRDVSNFLP